MYKRLCIANHCSRLLGRRLISSDGRLDAAEQKIVDVLKTRFPDGQIRVQDVSGGCGAMYEVDVVDLTFKGMPLVKQHQLVNQMYKRLCIANHCSRLLGRRLISSDGRLDAAEQKIVDVLKTRFPDGQIRVQDVSGGCGAMYEVDVVDLTFKGMPLVKQHQLVNQTLKNEIKEMHGIRISTALPGDDRGSDG